MSWTQQRTTKENRLNFEKDGIKVYFTVPDFIEIDKIHPDILKLAEWLMFSPWDETILDNHQFSRKTEGNAIGLAYSGGMDSTAALTLLERMGMTILTYMQREGVDDTIMKQEGPLYTFQMAEKIRQAPGFIFKTDFEKIRQIKENKMIGFSTDLCVLIGSLFIADHFGIKYLATGMMLESTYIKGGYEYRDFVASDYWKKHTEIFRKAGFELLFPVIPCSEIVTTKIAESGRYYGIGNSCLRSSVGGRGCMNCYKCFRKNMINGKLIPLNKESAIKMSQEHIKQGASLIHACNKHGFKVPLLDRYTNWDLSYLEGYYATALECIPEELRDRLGYLLEQFVPPMEFDLRQFKWGENY